MGSSSFVKKITERNFYHDFYDKDGMSNPRNFDNEAEVLHKTSARCGQSETNPASIDCVQSF